MIDVIKKFVELYTMLVGRQPSTREQRQIIKLVADFNERLKLLVDPYFDFQPISNDRQLEEAEENHLIAAVNGHASFFSSQLIEKLQQEGSAAKRDRLQIFIYFNVLFKVILSQSLSIYLDNTNRLPYTMQIMGFLGNEDPPTDQTNKQRRIFLRCQREFMRTFDYVLPMPPGNPDLDASYDSVVAREEFLRQEQPEPLVLMRAKLDEYAEKSLNDHELAYKIQTNSFAWTIEILNQIMVGSHDDNKELIAALEAFENFVQKYQTPAGVLPEAFDWVAYGKLSLQMQHLMLQAKSPIREYLQNLAILLCIFALRADNDLTADKLVTLYADAGKSLPRFLIPIQPDALTTQQPSTLTAKQIYEQNADVQDKKYLRTQPLLLNDATNLYKSLTQDPAAQLDTDIFAGVLATLQQAPGFLVTYKEKLETRNVDLLHDDIVPWLEIIQEMYKSSEPLDDTFVELCKLIKSRIESLQREWIDEVRHKNANLVLNCANLMLEMLLAKSDPDYSQDTANDDFEKAFKEIQALTREPRPSSPGPTVQPTAPTAGGKKPGGSKKA